MKPEEWEQRLSSEIWFEATTSRGPGGQNVNKVSSSAVLFWNARESKALTEFQKRLLLQRVPDSLLSSEGWIRIRSDERRDLSANKKNCMNKLISHLSDWLYVKPRRIATKMSRGTKAKNVEKKRHRGEIKRLRQSRLTK